MSTLTRHCLSQLSSPDFLGITVWRVGFCLGRHEAFVVYQDWPLLHRLQTKIESEQLWFLGKSIQSQMWTLQFKTIGQLKTMLVFALTHDWGVGEWLPNRDWRAKQSWGRTPNLILACHSQREKSCSEAQLSWYKGTGGLQLLPQLQTPLHIASETSEAHSWISALFNVREKVWIKLTKGKT